jgi:hypothetical protein
VTKPDPTAEPSTYDSRADTLLHSRRVGELMTACIKDLVDRSVRHDLSKTEPPELAAFDIFTPLKGTTPYLSPEYKQHLVAMKPALDHHFKVNDHHPQHGDGTTSSMNLLSILEMLCDWKASSETQQGGDLRLSIALNRERFNMSTELTQILINTAIYLGWLSPQDSRHGTES